MTRSSHPLITEPCMYRSHWEPPRLISQAQRYITTYTTICQQAGMSGLAPKWVRLAINMTNPDIFSDQISVHLIWKKFRISHILGESDPLYGQIWHPCVCSRAHTAHIAYNSHIFRYKLHDMHNMGTNKQTKFSSLFVIYAHRMNHTIERMLVHPNFNYPIIIFRF